MNLDYVIENVGDPDGILIADPTGFAKKGRKSAGVQRQYSGTLGRVDNCQIGTFLAFVNTAGSLDDVRRALIGLRDPIPPRETACGTFRSLDPLQDAAMLLAEPVSVA